MEGHYIVEQIKTTLAPIFRQNNVRKSTRFKSYCKGTATVCSDIGLLVGSGIRGTRFFGLLENVCISLDCPVNLIDTEDIIPDSQINRDVK